ncbi:DUF3987 domain-containing protein [Belnapia sp. T18]|uniref:DUF3987 domain-containing protein n=2 Tax=Belnapia arida TaxID=2804533 RepID=A0ABS1U9X5_9PROT|nr:DUF3987 domain-containing protein [Belnapia arida]
MLKTPVLKAATKPVELLDEQARQRHAGEMRRYQSKAKARLPENLADDEPPPKLQRFLVESTTIEALTEVLRDDSEAKQQAAAKKILVRQDEMSELVGNLDRYRSGGRGGGDRGAYLRLYNGGRHVVDRVGRGPLVCPNWSGCVLGGIQPEVIQRIAREAADDGLLQRFCYAVPSWQGRGVDRAPQAEALARYAALFPALCTLRPPTLEDGSVNPVALHADAQRHRHAVLELLEAVQAMPDTSVRVKAALGKWPGLFARIALLFHLIDLSDATARGSEVPCTLVVPEATAHRAGAYMRDILLPHLMRADAVMFSSIQTGHARWIAGFILAHERQRVEVRQIVRAYKALYAPEQRTELNSVMQSLEAMAWVRPETPTNPARPPSAWQVNPNIYTRFAQRAAMEREARRNAKARIAEKVERIRRDRAASEASERLG